MLVLRSFPFHLNIFINGKFYFNLDMYHCWISPEYFFSEITRKLRLDMRSVPPCIPRRPRWPFFAPPPICNGVWPLHPPMKAMQGRGGRGRSPGFLAVCALSLARNPPFFRSVSSFDTLISFHLNGNFPTAHNLLLQSCQKRKNSAHKWVFCWVVWSAIEADNIPH